MTDPELKPTAKVLFRVPEEDGSANVETLWAFDLPSCNGRKMPYAN